MIGKLPTFRFYDNYFNRMFSVFSMDWDREGIVKEIHVEIEGVKGDTVAVLLSDGHLMQSTGLSDKNGVEIFEGDILQYKYPYDMRMKTFGIVVWRYDKACFALKDMRGLTTEQMELYRITADNYLEVVGNIYENKELLKNI